MAMLANHVGATIFSSVHGLIHDPEHRPVQGATVTLRAVDSKWEKSQQSNSEGEFAFDVVPLGAYIVSVQVPGFETQQESLTLISDHVARPHFSLQVAKANETVEVHDTSTTVNSESSTTSNVVSRAQIASTPGAEQTNSLAMITNYTPSAYVVHDQLHIRGGHQVSWLLDGVPVPNTNIASNVGPQFDPKDIDYLEVQRGGYSAEYGDRTYGVFNVVTRSGFERNRQAELVTSYGSFNNTNDQLSFGDHSERFAYYGSVTGYGTDLGLETPSTDVLHDQSSGVGGFGSLIFNKSPTDQLRLVTSVRGDHYQVPNTPELQQQDTSDVENEQDAFANFSWLHSAHNGVLFTVSPFYHFNRAHYIGGPNDSPVSPDDDRGSNYVGGVATVAVTRRQHTFRAGLETFGAHDNQTFGLVTTDGSAPPLSQTEQVWGNVEAVFLEDQFKMTSWLTLNGGVRLTHFGSTISENAADPRIGAAIRVPKLNWVARASYGRYYQPPPLLTVSGPLLNLAASEGFAFLPLHGERDEQYEFGLAVPFHSWTFDGAYFHTAARNFFDHDVLGNSNIFFPLTIAHARIHGSEATVNSPLVMRRARFHLAFSHQYAEGSGGVTGGLTDFTPPDEGYFFLDHDQRNTLSTGVNFDLPWRIGSDFNLNYGSGFLDGDGPRHLPSHTSFDLAVSRSFGENWTVRLTVLNLSNNQYLLDNSNTFGGTHYVNPREISAQVKFRFHY
ncbi:MAG: TonB-dependent receptor [Acidobacteriales bacterium]|nr:TonB-dependent receptor [Terriglobales bacterium]